MGCCESSSYSRPGKKESTRERTTKRVSFCIPPEAIPEDIKKEIEINAKIVEQESQWIKQGEKTVQSDDRPKQFRDLMVLVQKMHHFYGMHDIDSAMVHIQQFEMLASATEKELKLSRDDLRKELEQEASRWAKDSKPTEQSKTETASQKSNQESHKDQESLPNNAGLPIQVQPFSQKLMDQIHKEYQVLQSMVQQAQRQGWQEQKNKEDLVAWTRREKDETVSGKIQTRIEVPVQIVLAVFLDIQLYTQSFPFTEVSRLEKRLARNSVIGYARLNMPVFSCRESFFRTTAYSRLRTHGEIAILQESLETKKEQILQETGYEIKQDSDCQSAYYDFCIYTLKPNQDGSTLLTVAYNPDLGLKFIPLFAVECALSTMGCELAQKIAKASKRFKGSQWENNLKKDSSTFSAFKAQIDFHNKTNMNDKRREDDLDV